MQGSCDNANEGNRAANGRGLSPSSGFLGEVTLPARGWGVKPLAGANPVWGGREGFQGEPSHALGLRLKRTFREERFSDGRSVSRADGTTCYPGQAHRGATAHDGVSVTVKGSENERAQSTYRPPAARDANGSRAVFRKALREPKSHPDGPPGLKLPSSPSPVVRGCAARSSSATDQ